MHLRSQRTTRHLKIGVISYLTSGNIMSREIIWARLFNIPVLNPINANKLYTKRSVSFSLSTAG